MEKDTLKNNLVEYELSNPIKVIGIGGCGSNTVNHIYRRSSRYESYCVRFRW